MRSLDTNILLRLFVQDTPARTLITDRLLSEPAYLTPTVLLETSWVLSSFYGRSSALIADDLRDLLAMPEMTVAQKTSVLWAIERFAEGADFADMLHLALSGGATSFATFDRGIARFADDTVVPVETVLA